MFVAGNSGSHVPGTAKPVLMVIDAFGPNDLKPPSNSSVQNSSPGPCARAATGASTTHSAMNKPATRARPFKKDVIYVSRLYRNEVRKRKWNASVARTRRAIGARRPFICDRRAQDLPDRTGQ